MTETRDGAATGTRAAGGASRPRIAAVRSELSNPLFRNAYALLLNGGLTGVLGLGYWFLAARFYDPAQVGRQSAENQAMMLLGGLTALNLLLIRFVPEMGRRTRGLVVHTYLAGGTAAAVLAAGFLFTLPWWGTAFTHLSGPGPGLFFLLAVVSWSLFTTQDGVLTGLRQAPWVLGKNAVFASLKILLLVVLATVLPHDGITVSWVGAAIVLLLPVEAFVQRTLIPRHAEAAADRPTPSGGQIGRYFAGDYVGIICYYAMCNLVPVVVAGRLDASTNAFFYMAWVLGATVDMLAVNMTMSLTVEGAFDAEGLAGACRSLLRRMALILVPITALIVIGARLGLSVFGSAYAEHGAALLRLLALATLPKALIEVYIGVLRVQRRTRMIAIVQAARLAGVLILVVALTPEGTTDIAGPGLAVLAVSLVAAPAVLPALLRLSRRPGDATSRKRRPRRVPGDGPGRVRRRRPPAAIESRPAQRGRVPVTALLPWAVFAAGAGLFWLPLRGVRLADMNGYGLISVLPVATLAGAGLLVAAFALSLGQRRPYRLLLALQLVAIVVALHGLAPALEPIARPPTAWQHHGFVEFIGRTGGSDYALDARFSWPAFFALVAFAARAVGVPNLEPVLHWAPVVSQLLYLAALALILRVMRASWRAKWLAAWLFVVADWVGQDYFSPQGFGYLLYLLFIGILLNWFRPDRPPAPWIAHNSRFRTFVLGPLAPGERPPPASDPRERTVLLLLLVVIFAVTTASHQLTPFLTLFACTALVLARRCTLRGLPVLLTVIVAGWIGFMATAYWKGNLDDMFSGAGALLANLRGGVAGRVSDGSHELATIQSGRILIAGIVLALALLGALRRRLGRIDDRVALILLGAPLLAVGLQSYGGEIALRVYFFVLPGGCLLAAYSFFPTTFAPARRTLATCAAGLTGLLIAGGFLCVRFGNENFEQVRPGDVRALDTVLRDSPNRMINLVWPADPRDDAGYFPMMPWGHRRMEQFDYTAVPATADPADLSGVLEALASRPGGYFVSTRGNEYYNRYNYGLPASYADRMRAALAAEPRLRPLLVDDDAVVYTLRQPPPGSAPPPPARPDRLDVGRTPWTPVGLAVLPVLIILLVWREIRRLRGGPRRRSAVAVTAATVALVVVLAAVLVERFLSLGA